MEQLFRESLLRLSGKFDQAVFELTQAMGGGKTHMKSALLQRYLRCGSRTCDLASEGRITCKPIF